MATKLLMRNMGSIDRAVRAFLIAPVAIGVALGVGASSIAGIALGRAGRHRAGHGSDRRLPGLRPVRDRHPRPHTAAHRPLNAHFHRDDSKKGRAMTTDEQKLSLEQKELVAVGASVGAGCHPCVDHHLKAGAKAGLDDERLLAAVTSAERVSAEAAVAMGDHVRGKLGPGVAEPALLSRLEEALASLGAALGANDAANIERQLRIALELGASRPQLEQAIEAAHTVQENAARIHLREAQRLLDALAPAVAAAEKAGHGCGCKPDEENAEAPLEAQAPAPAGETSELADAEAATTGPCASPAGFAESMNRRFATGGSCKTSRPSAAMADCHRMFEQCMPGAAPAETNEPAPATVAAGSDTKEV